MSEQPPRSPETILDLAYQRASAHITVHLITDAAIVSYVEYVCRNTESRAAVRLLITCLLAKIHNPIVDIRKPYTENGGADSFSGRSYDERYISKFIIEHELPCSGASVFLTPVLRNRNSPLTTDMNWAGRTSKVYRTVVELLDAVYRNTVPAEDLLAETLRWLLIVRNERREEQRNSPHNLTHSVTSSLNRPLRVFLCHASEDKTVVRALYHQLKASSVKPWLDEEDLIAGQDWELQIRKAVRESDVVLACLSRQAVSKRGFIQKEIKLALDVADEHPEGTIYVIPVKIEECDIPDRLKRWHYVSLSEERGYERLLRALRERARTLEQSSPLSSLPERTRERRQRPAPNSEIDDRQRLDTKKLKSDATAISPPRVRTNQASAVLPPAQAKGLPKGVQQLRNTRRNEVVAIGCFALSALLALSLLSYNPDDVPFDGVSNNGKNWLGTVGTAVSTTLFQLFGLSAVLLPLFLVGIAWRRFRTRRIHAPLSRLIGLISMIFAIASLLSLTIADPLFDRVFSAGGIVGAFISDSLKAVINPVGAGVLLCAAVAVGLLLATNFSFVIAYERISAVLYRYRQH